MNQNDTLPQGWQTVALGDIGIFSGGVTTIKKQDYGYGTPFLQYVNVYKNSKVDINNLLLMNVRKKDLISKNCIYGDIFLQRHQKHQTK